MSLLPSDPKERKSYLLGLKIAGDFGAAIALPIILMVILGQYLDGKYHKEPWFTILAFVVAALISGKIIYKKAKMYNKEYQELNSKDKNK